ncbi:glycosyltransferase family protein [Devosia aurantiaca]|uniref:Glycosyltransferase subfamily 4-like N-terminal domain-containing protein n=1 Tax=Devosia aurantiaca TaxID=2714858 RepID=A0A6M1SHH9_9HYPH|nr:hypothetical protein [Devosia aurantiaca]NGP19279.1 hypothetical protein [Devosia aurantiaca]
MIEVQQNTEIGTARNAPINRKLLMITSYGRPCGIAQYVEFLEIPLRAKGSFQFEVAALPVDLFRANGPYARKASAAIFEQILTKARDADVVSIQLEPGLFGMSPFSIWRRLRSIIDVSKRVLITYHTVPIMVSSRPKLSLQGLREFAQAWRGSFVFNQLFSAVRRTPYKFRHIVQTRREATNFGLLGIPPETIITAPFLLSVSLHEPILVPVQNTASG